MLGVFEKVRRGVGKCVGVWREVRGVRGYVGGCVGKCVWVWSKLRKCVGVCRV